MSLFFDRLRTKVSRRAKRGSFLLAHKESIWKRLPDNVLVLITSFSELEDIVSLALTCRLLHHRIAKNEYTIAHAFLKIHTRNRVLEDYYDDGIELSPGGDLTFVSELFPPPPPEYAVGEGHDDAGYTLGYLADLKRCWSTCIRLSYHLADHVVRQHLETDSLARPLWSSSKTEKEYVYSKAVETLQARLLRPLAYAIFFLENSSDDGFNPGSSEHVNDLFTSFQRKLSVLHGPPFNNTRNIILTEHCLQLLCSTVRRLMHPEFGHSTSEGWVSLLLLNSTMERIVDFFHAIAKDDEKTQTLSHGHGHGHGHGHVSTWSARQEFLWQMRDDLGHHMASLSNASAKNGDDILTLDHVWFKAAYQEMARRGAIPHSPEELVPVLHGSALKLDCAYCYDDDE
ncbi:hypothetical protein N7448_010715 [Penicillium atrosanguineum]|uniref:F-box domain-containing protein n=1 Tax=Penicillium atrosanguineum TaxID=1132637 RepID=A0A9W9GGU3_9EURO|nr:hypothetical protein N7526_010644 [Penicillium atrosanguineum]KAJ5120046.1 hypothetical protein N7448_010715 [Penicillium atrosanguineum]KAJ5299804.1 hypothetical protein N7476_011361 [Penicillium atrosanguineum]